MMYYICIPSWFLPFAILPSLNLTLREKFGEALPHARTMVWPFPVVVSRLLPSRPIHPGLWISRATS